MSIQTLTHIIYSSLVSIYLLIIVPFSIGTLICSKLKGEVFESLAYRFVVGFLSMLGIWAALALPFALFLKEMPFHYLRYAYILTITILCIIYVVLGRGKDNTIKAKVNGIQQKKLFGTGADRIYIVIFLLIFLIQLFETAYYAPVGYVQDDFFYYVDINETVYKDLLCFVGAKQTLAQWYMFLSFIAATTNIPTIIICRTLIPVYIIAIIYMSIYAFGIFYFRGDVRKERVYLMWSSLILEALSYSYYMFFMTLYISTWGKIIAGMVAIPILIISLIISATDKGSVNAGITIRKIFLLIAVGAGSATLSIASMISGSIALFLFMLTLFIYYRKKEIAIYIITAGLPFAIQLLAYVAVW